MAQVQFPNPGDANPDTGLTYGEGWTNPDNDITYVYNNGVWSAVGGPGGSAGGGTFVDIDGDHMTGDLTIGLQDGTINTALRTDGSASFAGNVVSGNWDGTSGSGVGASVNLSGAIYVRRDDSVQNNVSLFGGWKGANKRFEVNAGGSLYLGPSLDTNGIGANITLSGDGSASFAGNITAGNVTFNAGTVDEFNVQDRLTSIATLSGVVKGSVGLGTFTGTTISDDATLKQALQELETSLESSDSHTASNFEFDASLVPDTDSVYDIGSATHRVRDLYVSDASIKFASADLSVVGGNLQFGGVDLADANDVAEVNTDVTDIVAALGIGENVSDMGTFVSARLPDASNLRDVLENFASEYDTRVTSVDSSLALRAPLADPALTGTPTAPTAVAGTNTTQLATTAFVTGAVADLIDGAPGAIDTLNELAAALGDDPNFATTVTNSIATKLDASAVSAFGLTLVDDADAATARTTLGLGTAATTASTDYATAAQGATADAALAASAVSAFGLTLVDDADAATARATLGLGTAATTASTDYATAAQGTTADAALPAAGAQAALSVDHLITLSGVAESADNLGTFTGSTITDNVTVKAALQELETAVDGLGGGGDSLSDLRSFVGGNAGDTHLGTMIGNVVTDGVSVKTALNELVIRIEDHEDGTTNFTGFQLAGTAVTATGAELNILDGATLDVTELNYVDGVTSSIQTQLDAKAPLASPALTGTPTAPTAAVNTNTTQLATTAFVVAEVSNELGDTANAASMRTALGITENAGDPADGRGLYYDTSASKYLLSS